MLSSSSRFHVLTAFVMIMLVCSNVMAEEVHTVPRKSAEDIIMARIKPTELPERPVREEAPFGVCHGANVGYFNHVGVSWCRIGLPEFTAKKAEKWARNKIDDFPFSEQGRNVLEEGTNILGLINFKEAERWADADREEYLPVVRKVTYKMVQTHREEVDYWEVMNEPDLFVPSLSTKQVAAITRTAVKAARRADPEAKILSPCPTELSYMEDLLNRGIGDIVDGFAIHVYAQESSLSQQVDQWKNLFAEYGYEEKPVWMTETGYRSDADHGQTGEEIKRQWFRRMEDQAKYVVTSHVRLQQKGIEKTMWYAHSDVRDVHGNENWGFLWATDHPQRRGKRAGMPRRAKWFIESDHTAVKPSGVAHNTMAGQLMGKRLERELDAGIGVHMYRFAGPDGSVIVAWADEKIPFPIPVDGSSLRVTNLYGKQYTFDATGERVTLRLTDVPIYIHNASVRELEPNACTVHLPDSRSVDAGRVSELEVELENQLDTAFSGRVVFVPSPGLFANPESIDVALDPGERKKQVLSVEAASGAPTGTYSLRTIIHRGNGYPPVATERTIQVD